MKLKARASSDRFLKRSPKSFEGGFACPKHQEGFSRGNTRPEKLFKQIRRLKMELEWLKKMRNFDLDKRDHFKLIHQLFGVSLTKGSFFVIFEHLLNTGDIP